MKPGDLVYWEFTPGFKHFARIESVRDQRAVVVYGSGSKQMRLKMPLNQLKKRA